MDEKTKKIIAEHIAKLPPYIRESLKHISWGEDILAIGKKHGLHIDEMGALQLETVMVLVGIVHPDEYIKALRKELSLPEEKISAIVADVNEKIFKTIRQDLINFITTKEDEEMERGGVETENIFKETGIELSAEAMPTTEPPLPNRSVVGLAERSILEHAGVEVNEDRPVTVEIEAPDRKNILDELEHPPRNETGQFSHLIKSKLSDAVITSPEKTKYEDKPPIVESEAPRRSDPYREPI